MCGLCCSLRGFIVSTVPPAVAIAQSSRRNSNTFYLFCFVFNWPQPGWKSLKRVYIFFLYIYFSECAFFLSLLLLFSAIVFHLWAVNLQPATLVLCWRQCGAAMRHEKNKIMYNKKEKEQKKTSSKHICSLSRDREWAVVVGKRWQNEKYDINLQKNYNSFLWLLLYLNYEVRSTKVTPQSAQTRAPAPNTQYLRSIWSLRCWLLICLKVWHLCGRTRATVVFGYVECHRLTAAVRLTLGSPVERHNQPASQMKVITNDYCYYFIFFIIIRLPFNQFLFSLCFWLQLKISFFFRLFSAPHAINSRRKKI